MQPLIPTLISEISDNWPAFLYILIATGFSICFLRERRAETRALRRIGDGLQESINARFDRLERIIISGREETQKRSIAAEKRIPELVA